MAPVKVIVQGLPNHHFLYKDKEVFFHLLKQQLENSLAKYAPVRCVYIWPNVNIHQSQLFTSEGYDNFAQVVFKYPENAFKACDAAAKHKITINDDNLTLTPILLGTVAPIERLDDDCLITIFSMLEPSSRLVVEEVCERWKSIAKNNWSGMKKLIIPSLNSSDKRFEMYMSRCGKYLNELNCRINSEDSISLIQSHCKQLKKLTMSLDMRIIDSQALPALVKDLKSLEFFDFECRSTFRQFQFITDLPVSLKHLSISNGCTIAPGPSQSFNFSKFKKLQSLKIIGFNFVDDAIEGLENLTNLISFDVDHSQLPRTAVAQLMNSQTLKTFVCPESQIDDEILKKLIENNINLENLNVSGSNVTDESIRLLSSLPNLKNLDISYLSVNLLNLTQMSSLKTICCQSCELLEDECLIRLIGLSPKLRFLDVVDCPVTKDLFVMANTLVKTRDNGSLEVKTSIEDLNLEDQSPLLKISYEQRPTAWNSGPFLFSDDESNDSDDSVYDNVWSDSGDEEDMDDSEEESVDDESSDITVSDGDLEDENGDDINDQDNDTDENNPSDIADDDHEDVNDEDEVRTVASGDLDYNETDEDIEDSNRNSENDEANDDNVTDENVDNSSRNSENAAHSESKNESSYEDDINDSNSLPSSSFCDYYKEYSANQSNEDHQISFEHESCLNDEQNSEGDEQEDHEHDMNYPNSQSESSFCDYYKEYLANQSGNDHEGSFGHGSFRNDLQYSDDDEQGDCVDSELENQYANDDEHDSVDGELDDQYANDDEHDSVDGELDDQYTNEDDLQDSEAYSELEDANYCDGVQVGEDLSEEDSYDPNEEDVLVDHGEADCVDDCPETVEDVYDVPGGDEGDGDDYNDDQDQYESSEGLYDYDDGGYNDYNDYDGYGDNGYDCNSDY